MELIKKGRTINALTSFPCACGISTLNHEAFNDAVKECAIIVAFEAEL